MNPWHGSIDICVHVMVNEWACVGTYICVCMCRCIHVCEGGHLVNYRFEQSDFMTMNKCKAKRHMGKGYEEIGNN